MSVIVEPLELLGGTAMPAVTALRGGNSIEQLDGAHNTIILAVISGESQITAWQARSGTADPTDPQNQVQSGQNGSLFWQRVGGFGSSMLAGARLTNSTGTTLNHGLATALTFDTPRFNSGGWIATDSSKFTVTVPGIYMITGSAQFAANPTGQRTLSARVNGSNIVASSVVPATSLTVNVSVATLYQLASGDYVELVATQNSGSNLDVLKSNSYSPEVAVLWAGSNTVTGTTPQGNNGSGTSDTPPGGVTNIATPFNITDVGWYRLYQGVMPAAGGFRLKRADGGDGNIGDFEIDFNITGASPEGTIHLKRNSVSMALNPGLDGVRTSHTGTEPYVDVHLLVSGPWTVSRSSDDDGYVDAPFLNNAAGTDGSLVFNTTPNVVGGTVAVDTPQINKAGQKILSAPLSTWGQWTGAISRASRDSGTVTTSQLGQAFKALVDDLQSQGITSFGVPSTMLYTDMLSLASYLVSNGTTAVVTDSTKITSAPNTFFQGTYIPVGTSNSKPRYFLRGYEWNAASNIACCQWTGTIWQLYDASGATIYHQNAGTTNPWDAATWKDAGNSTVTVTFTAPNLTFTYGALTDTHTAMQVAGSSTGFNGLYLRGADSNGKRQYFLVGTGTNNKRIQWAGSTWAIKDDSVTGYDSFETVTFPDQVVGTWKIEGGGGLNNVVSVTGINAYDLASGVNLQGNAAVNGFYVPQIGGGGSRRSLTYRNISLGTFLVNNSPTWTVYASNFVTPLAASDTGGTFPWNASWASAMLTAQQSGVASPDQWTA